MLAVHAAPSRSTESLPRVNLPFESSNGADLISTAKKDTLKFAGKLEMHLDVCHFSIFWRLLGYVRWVAAGRSKWALSIYEPMSR